MPLYPTPTHTVTEICNHALAYVRQTLLTDFATDDTKSGQYCRLFFQQALEECLEHMGWTFSTKRIMLNQLYSDPPFGIDDATDKAYQLPEDFLFVIETEPDTARWRIEGNTLITDEGVLGMVYCAHQGDTSMLSAKFRAALALNLAAKLAMPMTGNWSMAKELADFAVNSLGFASHSDSRQESRQANELDNLTRVRL